MAPSFAQCAFGLPVKIVIYSKAIPCITAAINSGAAVRLPSFVHLIGPQRSAGSDLRTSPRSVSQFIQGWLAGGVTAWSLCPLVFPQSQIRVPQVFVRLFRGIFKIRSRNRHRQ